MQKKKRGKYEQGAAIRTATRKASRSILRSSAARKARAHSQLDRDADSQPAELAGRSGDPATSESEARRLAERIQEESRPSSPAGKKRKRLSFDKLNQALQAMINSAGPGRAALDALRSLPDLRTCAYCRREPEQKRWGKYSSRFRCPTKGCLLSVNWFGFSDWQGQNQRLHLALFEAFEAGSFARLRSNSPTAVLFEEYRNKKSPKAA
jgi:hypothetical protein